MISKIVEMDEKAKEIVNEGKQSKLDSVHEIAKKREQIRANMLKRARKKIEETRKIESAKADKRIKEIEVSTKQKAYLMDKTYQENCDLWVDTIIKHVLGE